MAGIFFCILFERLEHAKKKVRTRPTRNLNKFTKDCLSCLHRGCNKYMYRNDMHGEELAGKIKNKLGKSRSDNKQQQECGLSFSHAVKAANLR